MFWFSSLPEGTDVVVDLIADDVWGAKDATLSIAPPKYIFVESILECQNDTILPAALKLQH